MALTLYENTPLTIPTQELALEPRAANGENRGEKLERELKSFREDLRRLENRIKKKQLELVCFQSEMKGKWFKLLCNVEEEADYFDTDDCEYGCQYDWRSSSVVDMAKEVLGYKTFMENVEKKRKEKERKEKEWMEKKERLTRTNSKP